MSGSSTMDPGDRSSAEIEREVEATRSGLHRTLEELRDRASPGQLFEQAVDYARSSGGAEMMRNLGQAVRDNPLPLLLVGAGVGWLMYSGGNRAGISSRSHGMRQLAPPMPAGARDQTHGGMETAGGASMTERMSGAAGSAAGRVGDTAGKLRDSATGAASRAGETAGSAYRSAADAAGSAAESVSATAASAAERLSDAGQGARDRLGRLGDDAREGIGWMLREQPLVLGAIGVAVGAAIGALLPGTEAEDRLMGETRDRLADQARSKAQEGYERVAETAGEHLEHAKAVASEAAGQATDGPAGSAANRTSSTLTEVGQQVGQAARDAARDLAGEARGAMGADEPKADEPKEDPRGSQHKMTQR
jgi:ElaB/YqjD/DUF883 family membrane-anchored ribosome-binding protein